ncbi:MAG: DedA family protein [Deltaproteobacteria bacterium]|nr:DedA family protein [Deltaproteobacteria bacterium]
MVGTLFRLFEGAGPWVVLVGVALDNAGVVPVAGELYLLLAAPFARGLDGMLALFVAGALGAFLGDQGAYLMGRLGGRRIIDFYCRVTLCSAQCSRTTTTFFARYGLLTLLFARFVIGVRTLACPLAGSAGIPYGRFALYDALGAMLWAGIYTALATVFRAEARRLVESSEDLMQGVLLLVVVLMGGLVAYRYVRRKRYGAGAVPLRQGDEAGAPSPS